VSDAKTDALARAIKDLHGLDARFREVMRTLRFWPSM
jgi:hypothetical protein